MMRLISLSALAGSLGAASLMMGTPPATAQSDGCGPAVYSNEQQRYAAVPCTPAVPKAGATAEPCGIAVYSNADQKYSSVPCTAPTANVEQGKPAPCGPVAYSNADQTYVGVPCTQ